MKYFAFLACSALSACVLGSATAQGVHNFQWGGTIGGTGDDYLLGLSRDANGNVYVGGQTFSATVDFDFGPAISPFAGDATNAKAYLAKYAADGSFQWVLDPVDSTGSQRLSSVLADAAGNVYVAGRFGGTATFGSGPAALTATSVGPSDPYVVKYDSAGNTVWAKVFVGSSVEILQNQALALDGAGHLFVAGQFGTGTDVSPATINPDPATTTYLVTGFAAGSEGFVVKLDSSNGSAMASLNIAQVCDGTPPRIALDASAGVYIANTATCPGVPATVQLLKTNASLIGSEWVKFLGGGSGDPDIVAYGIAVRPTDGVVAIAGAYYGAIDLDPGTGIQMAAHGGADGNSNGYLLRLDANGTYVTSGTLFGSGFSWIAGVAYDETGRLYYGGGYSDNFIDPTAPNSNHAVAPISSNGMIGEIETNGHLGWVGSIESLTVGCYTEIYKLIPLSRDRALIGGDFNCGQVNLNTGGAPTLFDSQGGFDDFVFETLQDAIFNSSFEVQ